MDKGHCLIAISTPCHNLIGLVVGVTNDVHDFRYFGVVNDKYDKLYINKVVAKFGFLDKKDYDSSYYNTKTSFAYIEHAKIFGYSGNKDINTYILWDVRNSIGKITTTITSCCNQNVNGIYLLYMPTIKEMRLVRGFKSAKRERLWFCSDWKEDDIE